jgi:hypothetical protein
VPGRHRGFLQSTAQAFGVSTEDFADLAFSAETIAVFGYGCAIFQQSDIVNFQRSGWRPEEIQILAGLATVLPKNIFLYVANVPNIANLGTRFILQGGTQNNLAVVKAEVDFIRRSFGNGQRQRLPDRGRDTGNSRGRLHEGNRYLRRKQHSVSASVGEPLRPEVVHGTDVRVLGPSLGTISRRTPAGS